MEINYETLFEAVDAELAFHKGQYIMTPTGIGCGVAEFKSVYSSVGDSGEAQVLRQENFSLVALNGSVFKVF